MILSTRSVSQVGRLLRVVGFFVSASGTLADGANAQVESCDDITGNTRCSRHVGELKQIENPINASVMLKWIEQSQEVAESIRANEVLVCRLSPTKGRDWEGQILRLNNNVISNSVRRLRGKQRIPAVVSRVITPGLERVGRQTGLGPVNSFVPATLSDAGFSWVISNLTHPDFGTSVQHRLAFLL